ncbi:MAG: outer membrane protein transport protein [Myxococcales bacterium]|nr:outer membrane protein transport protein [Myxococcales bacterium]MCB9734020.1 outer membrane protein transport protein [Deltaproteobacteria bacterium]
MKWLWALAALVPMLSPPAQASGLLAVRFGGEHGHPTTSNPTAIYFNPAGMSLMGGTRLMLDGTFAWRSLTYTRDPGAIDNVLADPNVGTGTPEGDGVAANSGEGHLFNLVGSPFAAIVTDFGVEGLGVGLGFYVPFGGSSSFDQVDASDAFPGAKDGPQRWWAIDGTLRALYFTGAVSYRFPDLRLSVGAGLNVVLTQMATVRARNSDGTDHLVSNGTIQEGRALIDVSSVDVAISAGIIWEPVDGFYLGLSYQSQPGFGTSKLTGDTTLVFGATPSAAVEPTPSEFYNGWPDVWRLGGRYTVPKAWEVRLFGELARWSSMYEHCLLNSTITPRACKGDPPPGKIVLVPRRWEDTFALRAGGSYWVSDAVELYLGAGWDGNAIPDSTVDPGLYDNDKVSVAVGGRFSLLDESLIVSVTYTQLFYPDRTVAPRQHLPGATTGDIASLGFSAPERDPDAAGKYEHAIGVLDVSVEARF